MKKSFTLLVVLLSGLPFADAQQHPIDISSDINSKNEVVFTAKRFEKSIFTVVLNLFDTENMAVSRFQRLNVDHDGNILTIRPLDPKKPVSYRYSYRYFPGDVNPRRVDRDFVYRLPFGLAKNREVRELYNVYDRHFGGDEHSVDFKAFQFIMDRADTVYAARKGVVIRVIDGHDPLVGMGTVSMRTENNEIFVQHADGTIARYGVLEKGSIRVEPGDMVYPGTPIAITGTLDNEIYQLRLYLYYQTDNLNEITDLSDYSTTSHGLDPLFATSEGETTLTPGKSYTPVTSEELITREMTKREIRASEL